MFISTILTHIGSINVIAMATLATKVAILDGWLFQRGTTTYIAQDPVRDVTVRGIAAQSFPETGYVVSHGAAASSVGGSYMISDTYTPTVNTWETSYGFFQGFQGLFRGCDGICYTYVDAIGFEIDCQKSTNHTRYAEKAIQTYNTSHGAGDSSEWTKLPIFDSSFNMEFAGTEIDYSRVMLNLLYFDSDDAFDAEDETCPGTLTRVQCSLRPALVRYPVTVVNFTNTHVNNGVSIGGTP